MNLEIRFIIFFFALAISCASNPTLDQKKSTHSVHGSKRIENIVPLELVYDHRSFNLDSTSTSKNAIEIRIWPKKAFLHIRNVVILKKDKSWRGLHYYSYTLPVFDPDGTIIESPDSFKIGDSVFLVREFTPISGWKTVEDSIKFFDLPSFPVQDSIIGFRRGARDGIRYFVEIIDSNSYQHLYYSNPEAYSDSVNRKFSTFIEMIERNLGPNYSWPRKD